MSLALHTRNKTKQNFICIFLLCLFVNGNNCSCIEPHLSCRRDSVSEVAAAAVKAGGLSVRETMRILLIAQDSGELYMQEEFPPLLLDMCLGRRSVWKCVK